tara:strand:- start:60001 stop:60324 length:324 start_codon:yes stop_codon:yes gene_type:complete
MDQLMNTNATELIDLLQIAPDAEPKPSLLILNDSFKVMRLVLPAGKTIPEHKAPKEITVQCVSGSVDFTTKGETHHMTTGKLLHLEPGELHALTAIEASVMLVTMAK